MSAATTARPPPKPRLTHASPSAGTASCAPTPRPTSSGCAARSSIEHTLADAGRASGCGSCSTREPYVAALGALTGNQAVQHGARGPQGDLPLAAGRSPPTPTPPGQMYPDQSLYPANSVPAGRAPHQPRAPARRPDRARRGQGRSATGSRRSSPTPRPASAARSTPSS